MVSKVQSLKLDTSVWSNEIVQVSQEAPKQPCKVQPEDCFPADVLLRPSALHHAGERPGQRVLGGRPESVRAAGP